MKRFMCILLAYLLCMSLLIACSTGTAEDDSGTQPSTEDIPTAFTGVCNGVDIGGGVSVTVCDAYKGSLGEYVNVYMADIDKLELKKQDEILVEIKNIEKTNPLTVTAHRIRVVEYGPNHTDENIFKGYGHGPFYILDHDQLYISDSFPANENDGWETELRKYNWSYYSALCVVKITDNAMYLASVSSKAARYVLYGDVSKLSVNEGEYVQIEVSKHYDSVEGYYEKAYVSDIVSLKTLNDEEILDAYRWSAAIDKPVIYLYPETPTQCSVTLDFAGELTCTYPEYNSGWRNFTAYPDSTLVFPDGKQYYCLYWEGISDINFEISEGFCVRGEDTASFLEKALSDIGLTPREANEFIIYWLPQLQHNEYNLISFIGSEYNDMAKLNITPAPDSVLRVYMVAAPLDEYVDIPPQTFDTFERRGFCVVEWGGSIIE